MKNTKFLIALFAILTFLSCDKSNLECNDIDYGKLFIVEANNIYCLPDGNYLEVKELDNQFCPYNFACLWEGEMIMYFSLNFDGQEVDSYIGSSFHHTPTLGVLPYEMIFTDVKFVEPPSIEVPSPEIAYALAKISNN